MKGVILAAGQGSRMNELGLSHKALAIVGSRHLIDYSLDMLTGRDSDGNSIVDEIIIVVGFHAEAVIDYVGDMYNGIKVRYVFQSEPKGIAHAVKTAKEAVNDDMIMCLADEILINPHMDKMAEAFYQSGAFCVCGVISDKNDLSFKPIAYDFGNDGRIIRAVEKPDSYRNEIRGIGECIFSKAALDYLDSLLPNPVRGEYEMGDWIQSIIDDNKQVEGFILADGYFNINTSDDVRRVNDFLQKKQV